jgi:hypothetical protein
MNIKIKFKKSIFNKIFLMVIEQPDIHFNYFNF